MRWTRAAGDGAVGRRPELRGRRVFHVGISQYSGHPLLAYYDKTPGGNNVAKTNVTNNCFDNFGLALF